MKLLALDIGDSVTGIAIANSSGIFVSTRPDVLTNNLQSFLVDFVAQNQVKTIVYGLPLNSIGQEAFQCAKVKKIIQTLDQALKDKGFEVDFIGIDERRSSLSARAIQGSNKGQSKSSEHAIAAALMLEVFIQRKKLAEESED